MKSKDVICEMQEQHDAFEKSFSALDTRTGLGEGTEQQRAKSLYLTTISFGMSQGENSLQVQGLWSICSAHAASPGCSGQG